MQTATCGALGPRDVLLSCGLSGMAYAYCDRRPFASSTGCTSRETQRGAARRWRRGGRIASMWRMPRVVGQTKTRKNKRRCLAGQPMTFVAPTGLTLSFIGALSAWTIKSGVPFLPMYAWCGCWTALYLAVLASFNASGLIRYCTRFTEDVFNALLAFNFVSEGFSPVRKVIGASLASSKGAADALLAANAAGGT